MLHKFLSELRRTGKPDVAHLGLFANWRTQADKHPGRALVVEMAKAGIGASAIHKALTISPGQYPGARVPRRRTIADWVSLAKKSAGSAKQTRFSSEDDDDDPKN